jgi:hypothetical protein
MLFPGHLFQGTLFPVTSAGCNTESFIACRWNYTERHGILSFESLLRMSWIRFRHGSILFVTLNQSLISNDAFMYLRASGVTEKDDEVLEIQRKYMLVHFRIEIIS